MDSANHSGEIVPENFQGKSVDLEENRELATLDLAIKHFTTVCRRLKHPSQWHNLTGVAGAMFTPHEILPDQEIKVGDFIKIDLPAPGSAAGEGHDWVKVAQLGELQDPLVEQSFSLTLEVTVNPAQPEKGIAHFFSDGATSTFIVKRKNKHVTVSYHGRNEKPNLSNEGMIDKVRNTVVALGAIAGISELQWKALVSGVNKLEDQEM